MNETLATEVLFAGLQIGRTRLRNRIAMPAMTRSFSPGGVPGPDVAAYYARRAAGGCGLIITEGTWVPHPSASNNADNPDFFGAAALAGWAGVVAAVHAHGAAIMPQLWHVGLMHRSAAGGQVQAPEPHHRGPSGISGGVQVPLTRVSAPMTLGEIDQLIDAFAEAGRAAMALGFDGVELHGAHGYLLDQFLWGATNRRSDRYGGSHRDRGRFVAEIVSEIRHRTAPGFPILLRFSQWKLQDYAARLADTPGELGEMLAPIVDAGVDVFDCSQRRFWEPAFAGSDRNLAGWTRDLTGRPTMTVGSVGLDQEFLDSMTSGRAAVAGLDRLLAMFGQGQFDLVAVGRAMLADAEWTDKVRRNHTDTLIPFEAAALARLA